MPSMVGMAKAVVMMADTSAKNMSGAVFMMSLEVL